MISFALFASSSSACDVNKQRGAVVLMTVTLLLIIVTLTTLYTGRNQTFEHQIIVNNQNHQMAQIAAEAGLQKQIAMLQVNKGQDLKSITESLSENNTFTVNSDSKLVATSYGQRLLITLNAVGKSADGLAETSLTEQVLIYPTLQNIPLAPLMVQGGFGPLGQFELVTNTNGLGVTNPLTIWSDNAVTMPSAASTTCELLDFNNGDCATKFISNSSLKSSDILENSSAFPTNIFGYLFNVVDTEIAQLKVQANLVITDCKLLNNQSRGFVWVTGDCSVDLGEQIGASANPVILIVENGNVIFDKHASLYGVLVSYQNLTATLDHHVTMDVGAAVYGAVLANHKLGHISSVIRVVYDANLLTSLTIQKDLLRVAKVPGSWRDF